MDQSLTGGVARPSTLQAEGDVLVAHGLGYRFEKLDPNLVRWSRFYNRSPYATSQDNEDFQKFLKLLEASEGNAMPVLVFEIEPDADGKHYEAVYGHRRLEGCRQLGFKVLAVVQEEMSAQEQGSLQLIENEGQSRLSVIERGKQIASQISQGIWPNVGALGERIGYTRTYAQHLKTIGEHIPDSLLLAHPDPSSINFRTAQALVRLAKDDKPLLKSRIETMRKEKESMTPMAATTFLLTGEIKEEQMKPSRAPQASLQRLRDGLKVTIRGLGTDFPNGLEERLKQFLEENGIDVPA